MTSIESQHQIKTNEKESHSEEEDSDSQSDDNEEPDMSEINRIQEEVCN